MEWKDITTFSRGDKERKPTTYEIRGKRLRIVITCGHIRAPGEWVMNCDPWFDVRVLAVETIEEAKEKAIRLVDETLSICVDDIDRFKQVMGE